MPGIETYDCEGTLTIGGISMNRPAWAVLGDETGAGGLLQLVTTASQRGQNRTVPSAAGTIAYRRRLTTTSHELRLLVVGDVDQNGAPVANPQQGLAINLSYLYTNVVAPVASATGTRAATLAIPGLATLTADIHVTGLLQTEYHIGQTTSAWVGRLQIEVPAGRFV